MNRRIVCILAALCLLLTGCSWMDGSYVSVEAHHEREAAADPDVISASNNVQLREALEEMIQAGRETVVINVADYNQEIVQNSMALAVRHVQENYPLGAYAVESIEFEMGTNAGKPAIAVTIQYRHSRTEIQQIRRANGVTEASKIIAAALRDCEPGVVILIENYSNTDFGQLVSDYADQNPHIVMETPQVTAGIYPNSGFERVVELTFTYQTSRDILRHMQKTVEPVFNAAELYVRGDGDTLQKYTQLYAFLMERFDYEITTSITPTYSLLRHGVGDERAFANVYAAMCRQAGLECMTVTGTRNAEPWCWNIICYNGNYYHVDLLRSSGAGGFRTYTDQQMQGYVWDYSAYPVCMPREDSRAVEET